MNSYGDSKKLYAIVVLVRQGLFATGICRHGHAEDLQACARNRAPRGHLNAWGSLAFLAFFCTSFCPFFLPQSPSPPLALQSPGVSLETISEDLSGVILANRFARFARIG